MPWLAIFSQNACISILSSFYEVHPFHTPGLLENIQSHQQYTQCKAVESAKEKIIHCTFVSTPTPETHITALVSVWQGENKKKLTR